jgi:phage terminase large subunit GpA-like protein
VFVNCSLAEGWSEGGSDIDDASLLARARPFSIDAIPKEVLLITAGCDVQDDRLEVTLLGWARAGETYVLDHRVMYGSPHEQLVWQELDDALKSRWKSPLGGMIEVAAACVDSGDGETTAAVYAFAFPRASRKVMATKGVAGTRPAIEASKGKMQGGGRLWIAGVDGLKSGLFDRLQRDQGIHFSNTLPPVFFEQLCAERRVTRYARGRPSRRFEVISGRRNEALDCVVLGIAARAVLKPNFELIEARLRGRKLEQVPLSQQFARARRPGEQ